MFDGRKYTIWSGLTAFLLLTSMVLLPGAAVCGGESNSETVLVTVNGGTITSGELERFIKGFLLPAEERIQWDQAPEFERAGFRSEALQMMIDRHLLLSQARERIDGKGMDAYIDETIKKMLSEMEEGAGSRVALMGRMHEGGITLNDWKRYQADTMLIQNYLREEIAGVHIRPAEMKEYYRRNNNDFRLPKKVYYRVIYIAPRGAESQQDVRERAEHVLDLVERGYDFKELARRYCFVHDDDKDGLQVEEGRMHPWVSGLRPGEVSGVIEGRGEVCAIAKLEKIQPEGVPDFREVQNEIRDRLWDKKIAGAQNRVLEKLRTEADINFTGEGRKLVEDDAGTHFWQ